MKKSTKIILIIAVGLLSAGLVLTLTGHFLGASYSRIVREDLWVWNIGDHESSSPGIDYDSEFDHDNTYEIDPDGINQLSIDWISGDIQITAYDGDKILIRESSKNDIDDDNCLRYRVRNGSLEISCCREAIGISFNALSEKKLTKRLVVKLPRALAADLKELSVDAVSSDLTVSGLAVKEFASDSVSGNVTLEKCSAAEIETNTTSGHIRLSLLTCPKELSADSTSGNIRLQLPHDSSFYLEYETVSGDASIKGFDAKHLNEDDDYGEYQVGRGGGEFSVDTVSGDITITRAGHH